MDAQQVYDVTIVGGGPAGLYAAFYCGLRDMTTKIIEYQPQLGGKIHLYPEKMIWDVGGLTPVNGAQLIEQLTRQGLTFDPEVVLGEKVTSIAKDERGIFHLHTSSGREHVSRTVIMATGSGILNPVKLNIEGAERFEMTNLHYAVKSLARFKGKTVLISGGGHSAIDWANELVPIAKKVYLVCRKETLKGHEAEIARLIRSSAECYFHASIHRFVGSPDHAVIEKAVLIQEIDGKETEIELEVDEVMVHHGFEQDVELLQNSNLPVARTDDGYIAGSPLGETSVEGLFAAGDILKHPYKINLIAGAFQDAVHAANRAKLHIAPEAGATAMVSSHNERFDERNRELLKHLYTR